MSIRPVAIQAPNRYGLQVHTHRNLPASITFQGDNKAEDKLPPAAAPVKKEKSSSFMTAMIVGLGTLVAGTGIGATQLFPPGTSQVRGIDGVPQAQTLEMTGELYKSFGDGENIQFAFRDGANKKSYIIAPARDDNAMVATLKTLKVGDHVKVKTLLGGGLNMTQYGPYTTLEKIEKVNANPIFQSKELNLKGTLFKPFEGNDTLVIRDEKTNTTYVLHPEEGNEAAKEALSKMRQGDRVRTKVILGGGLNMTRWGAVVSVQSIEAVTSKPTLKIQAGKLYKVPDVAFNQLESYIIKDGKTGNLYRLGKDTNEATATLYKQLRDAEAEAAHVTGTVHESDTPGEPATLIVSEIFTMIQDKK